MASAAHLQEIAVALNEGTELEACRPAAADARRIDGVSLECAM